MPQDASISSTELWKLWIQAGGYAITWIIVFVGWKVNSWQNNQRDIRKEVREHVDDAVSLIREAEANGVSFLNGEKADTALYWSIYFSVQRILPAVEELPLPNQEQISRQLVLFRKLMTNKVTVGPKSPFPSDEERQLLLLEVSRGANRFIATLEDGYRSRYPLR